MTDEVEAGLDAYCGCPDTASMREKVCAILEAAAAVRPAPDGAAEMRERAAQAAIACQGPTDLTRDRTCEMVAAAIRALPIEGARQEQVPAFRCDNCDNGAEPDWPFCAWCGAPGCNVMPNAPSGAGREGPTERGIARVLAGQRRSCDGTTYPCPRCELAPDGCDQLARAGLALWRRP